MQKNTNSNKWFFNFNFVNISHFTYAFVSKKISLFNKSFSYSHPVIWYCRCSMALLSFFRDKREVDIFSSSFFVIKFRGYLEKSHARQNEKFSCFHSNFDANTISLNQVINLITRLVDLFCDFAKELKARANTKNKRNIPTLRSPIWNGRFSQHKERDFPALFILPHNWKIQDVQKLLSSLTFAMLNKNL